jgi:quercetin dioxygenase-like cupin family protein|tara:strand:+ start:148 stop:474 length:327 start_codon:yes stop_codon:yes gene_type:complete
MSFCDIENRASKELAPGVRARTFWAEKILLVHVELDAGARVPDHSHPHEQCGTVVAGEIVLSIGGETRTLTVGDCYVIPGGVEHWATTGSAPAKVVDVFSPVREEYQY